MEVIGDMLKGDVCTQGLWKDETLNWKFFMNTDGIITTLTLERNLKIRIIGMFFITGAPSL